MPIEFKKVKLFHDHWLGDNEIAEIELTYYIEGYVTESKMEWLVIALWLNLDQIKKFNEIQKLTEIILITSTFKIIDDR
jgi:hypothetical protein